MDTPSHLFDKDNVEIPYLHSLLT